MANVPRNIMREMETDVIKAVELLPSRPNVARPSPEEIRSEAENYGRKTNFGNYHFVSSVKNRSAALTVYLGSRDVEQKKLNDHQKHIIRNLPSTLAKLHEYLKHAPFARVKRFMGRNHHFVPQCKVYVSTYRNDCIRLPYFFLSSTGFIPLALVWTGFRMSTPISIMSSMMVSTAPQECRWIFAGDISCICLKNFSCRGFTYLL